MKKLFGYIFLIIGALLSIPYPVIVFRTIVLIVVALRYKYITYGQEGYSIGYIGISISLCSINGIIIFLLYKYGIKWVKIKR